MIPRPVWATAQGLYEPIHGSAPDIAGKDVNPTAIISAAMMLRASFPVWLREADAINAVNKVLNKGLRTADNMSEAAPVWAAPPWVTLFSRRFEFTGK